MPAVQLPHLAPSVRHHTAEQDAYWGLGRFVFAQRVKGFLTGGPVSIPAKCRIYPSRFDHQV